MLPTCLFILHVEPADGGFHGRKILILRYWVGGELDRLPTDVHACDAVRVRLEAASYAAEVSPVSAVLAGDVSASWACLARVSCGDFRDGYAVLRGLMGECVAEESVGYPVRLSSTLTAQLSLPSPEFVEAFDGDACLILLGQVRQLFGEQPSVCADIVALPSAQSAEFESCFASMPVLVSVLLQFGAAALVVDLSQRDVASKVELLQNPASPLVHHGDSNAIGVLVYADNVLRDLWRWRGLLEQHEETVATGHQDACGSPTITDMFQKAPVGSVPLDGQAETFTVAAHTQNGVSASCTAPREEALVEAYRRLHNPVGDLASLPSVPLGFLDQLARYLSPPIVSVDCVVQRRVRPWLRGPYCLECGGRDVLEAYVGFLELTLFCICQRCKVELQHLLRRYLPQQTNVAPTTSAGELGETVTQFLPRINSWVSLRCF